MKAYTDIINESILTELKNKMSEACTFFNFLHDTKAINKRESNIYETYNLQHIKDVTALYQLRDRAQAVADICNKMLIKLSVNIEKYYHNDNDADLLNDALDKIQ